MNSITASKWHNQRERKREKQRETENLWDLKRIVEQKKFSEYSFNFIVVAKVVILV